MSDTGTWTPSAGFGGVPTSSGGLDDSTQYAQNLSNRVKLIASTSPYLAANPDAIYALANNPNLSNSDLATQSAAMTGQIGADTMATSMKKMDPSAQRLLWGNMTSTQRSALTQLGYQGPPQNEGPGFLERTLGVPGRILGDAVSGPAHLLGDVVGPTLHALQVVGDQPAHLYRAIRTTGSDTNQELALGVGLAAALGIAAAPFTGGLSLGLTVAAAGLGGLGAATAVSALTNPTDWVDAMRNTYDGEHVFTRDSQRDARTILGNDATLNNLAKDIAYDGSIYDLASDFASNRDGSDRNTMLRTVDKIASKIVDPTDPTYQQVTNGLVNVISNPNFMKAVNTLQMGKISFGRDFARTLGITPGSGIYNVVSGGLDGLWVMTLDPTLAVAQIGEWNKVRRFGVPLLEEGGATAGRIADLFDKSPSVRRYADILADGIDRSDPQHIKNMLPNAQSIVPDLIDYRNELRSSGELTGAFTRDNLLDWYRRGDGIKAMGGGRSTVMGEAETIFPHMGVGSFAWAKAKNYTKAVIDIADDNAFRRLASKMGEDIRPLEGSLAPSEFIPNAEGPQPAFNLGQDVNKNADTYRRTQAVMSIFDKIPGVSRAGSFLGSATTLVPKDAAMAVTGAESALDVDKAVDLLGRVTGMTRDDRAMWKGFMLDQANPGMKMQAATSFIDAVMTSGGMKSLPEGLDLSDKFLFRYHQAYASGGLDQYVVGGQLRKVGILPMADQAVQLVMPDLKLLRQAVKTQTLSKYFLNAADAGFLETAMNKVWKPAVLLRLGFIPRAAGEELLNAFARIGPSRLVAEAGERSIAQGKLSDPNVLAEHLGLYNAKEGTYGITHAQYLKTRQWEVAAHVRPIETMAGLAEKVINSTPLERMFGRMDWQQPIHNVLANYSTWLRGVLEDGVLPDRMVAAMPGGLRDAALGNARGLRHFILNGSNADVQEAAMAFQGRFGDAIMKSVSASNAGIWDQGVRKNLISHAVPDAANPGQYVTEMYLPSRGRFVNYEKGDWQYNNAIHEQLQHAYSDGVVGSAYGDLLTRHTPEFPGLGTAEAAQFADEYSALAKGSGAVHEIIRESLDGKPLTTVEWDGLRNTLLATGDLTKTQVDAMRIAAPDGDITPAELIGSLREALAGGRPTAKSRALLAQIDPASAFIDKITTLDDRARGWLAPFLEHGNWTPETLRDGSYFIDPSKIDGLADERIRTLLANPANQDAIKSTERATVTPAGEVVRNPVPQGRVRVYNPAISPPTADKLSQAIAALGQPGADGITNIHAAVDALMEQWQKTTKTIGGDLGRYDDVAENFFTTLVQKHDQLADLAATTERMDKTGIIPISFYALDDPNVAGALTATMKDFVGATQETGLNRAVSYMDVSRKVGDLRDVHIDGLAAPFRSAAGPVGWQADSAMLHGRAAIVPPTAEFEHMGGQWTWGTSAEQSMEEWAKVIRERVNQVSRSGVKTQYFANDRELYKNVKEGRATVKIAVAPGEELAKGREYIDGAGKVVRFGDSRFMEQVANQAEGAPFMWDIVGPAIRDSLDEARGTARFTANGERVFRSKVDQVANSDAVNLPDGALGIMETPYKQGTWDKVVNAGFDKVISPALDAIARKPLAFHEFSNAYIQAKQLKRNLLMDENLIDRLIPTHFAGNAPAAFHTDADRAAVLADARSISHLFDNPIEHLPDDALLQTLDGMGQQGIAKLQGKADLAVGWENTPDTADYRAATRLLNQPEGSFKYMQSAASGMDRNVQFTKDMLAKVGRSINAPWEIAKTHAAVGSLERGDKSERALFRALDEGGWTLLQQAKTNLAHVETTVGELATERAISNTLPFIHNHDVRSQMSEYGKQLIPFWYAQENFMRRWANTLRLAPEALRKGQLTYMGIKSAGVVRTDAQGKDWFVYPGSGALAEALGKVPGLSVLPIGAMLQAQPKDMLPGFNDFGAPSASPLITFPMDVATSFFPELRPIQKAVAGGSGVDRGIARHLIPSQIYNVWEAAFGDENSSPRFASAMTSAAAYMEAHGNGLPDNADANTTDEYMRTLKNHARTIMIAQALVGFVAPGSPQQVVTGESGDTGSSFTGLGVDDVNRTLRDEYLRLVRLQGIDQGTATFMNDHPKGDLEDLVNPLAFSVGTTTTVSGSALPATAQAVAFYDDHRDFLHQFPDAAGYLLPPDQGSTSVGDVNAYTEQTINGLRKRRTPTEFLQAIKYKEGAFDYYKSKDLFDMQMINAKGDRNVTAQLQAAWGSWAAIYKAQHPVFADQLESSDGRQRRQDTLQQLRVALDDPAAPQAWHTGALKQAINDFDAYRGALSELANDRTARAQALADQIRKGYSDYLGAYVLAHPELEPLYTSVLRPEAAAA